MTYDVASQLQYTNVAYRTKDGLPKGATIASGGCGPSSVRNLGNNLLGWNTTIPKVAAIAVDCGARYNGGTTISALLKAMKAKYGNFTYEYTTDDDKAFAAVKGGAMAIIHTPGAISGSSANKLLSSSGHFLCLAAVSGNAGTIIDSCSYDGKWAQYNRPKYIKTTNQTGVVKCSTTMIAKAIDYYYIVKKAAKITTPANTTTPTAKKENDEVVQNVKMKINGSVQNVKSILKDGRNYVQLAQIGELLGLQIGYTDKTPTVDFAQLKIKIAGTDHTVSGGVMAPGTSYAAVRELLELLGYEVGWDADAKAVTVKCGDLCAGSGTISKELGDDD